ncbi:hypothetical protein Nepgr_032312 [Nepenthes gracilis]|uniref:Uncharacterized protein n=1 Tax=Nepenthes gracilis TaxID=150966 RepID=A0AAD3TJV2_NEPGR|nr:hypothetical protein Nepgr_032312 [Nepenthes gracilis]
MDDLQTAQYTTKAHEDTSQSDMASSHSWLMPTCSRSTQMDAHSILSPVETSNLAGRLPSDEISTAGVKGDVDADASTNPRDEHVLLSYSVVTRGLMLSSEKQEHDCKCPVLQCNLNEEEARLPAVGFNTASYVDITMRRIDYARADEPGICAALSVMFMSFGYAASCAAVFSLLFFSGPFVRPYLVPVVGQPELAYLVQCDLDRLACNPRSGRNC